MLWRSPVSLVASLAFVVVVGITKSSSRAENMMTTAAAAAQICSDALSDPAISNPRYAFCTGIIVGVIGTDAVKAKQVICVAPDLTTQGAIGVFLAYFAAHKDQGSELHALVILKALQSKYPCR